MWEGERGESDLFSQEFGQTITGTPHPTLQLVHTLIPAFLKYVGLADLDAYSKS